MSFDLTSVMKPLSLDGAREFQRLRKNGDGKKVSRMTEFYKIPKKKNQF